MENEKHIVTYLLKGDLNGIQRFIFNVQTKGAAKSLKAKSYYIQLIGELFENVCHENLNKKSIQTESFYNGGGNFFIKIFSEFDIRPAIDDLQKSINKTLLHDEIDIVLTYEILSDDFSVTWNKLLQKSNKEKYKRYSKSMALFQPFLYSFVENEKKENCFSHYLEKELNEHNDLYKEITRELVKHDFITVDMLEQNVSKSDFNQSITNKLPFWSYYPEKEEYRKYRKRQDKKSGDLEENHLIDFNGFGDFAAHRTGTGKLGILKMDVDNLGKIFGSDVKDPDQAKELSIRMKSFFDKDLYEIWETEDYKSDIYPVFAGGDDCFIVGAWDKLITFAYTVRNAFHEIFNGKYTLSAGIIITDPTYPVVAFAEEAEKAVKKAKRKPVYSNTHTKKNAVCLFNEVFSWDEFGKIIKLAEVLTKQINEEKLERSFLEKIRLSAKGFGALQQQILKKDKLEMPKIWRLRYYLGRKKDDKEFEEIIEKLFQPYWEALYNALTENEATNPAIYPVAARIADLSTRKLLNYDQENE